MMTTKFAVTAAAVCVAALAAAAPLLPAASAKEVVTPFGRWPQECVHAAPHGSHVVNEDGFIRIMDAAGRLHKRVKRCAVANRYRRGQMRQQEHKASGKPNFDSDGWQVYTHQRLGNVSNSNITQFLGTWSVPQKPDEQAQTLFTFTGLQNIDWVPPQPQPFGAFDIIQPVLQFGASAAGGGGYWSMASWYVTLSSDVVYSPLTPVKGKSIFGNMTKVADDAWFINTVDVETGVSTNVTVSRSILRHQPWIYVTLETYDVETCLQYPPKGSVFDYTKMSIKVDGKLRTPDWEIGTQGQQPPVCGATIDIVDPSHVTIHT